MKVKIVFIALCTIIITSCKKHECSCTEYNGDKIIQQYEKSLSNALTCEDLSTYTYTQKDTTRIICGETNPL